MLKNLANKRICVTGGAGFLGRAVCDRLRAGGASKLTIPRSAEFDLTRRDHVQGLFDKASPEIIIHLAAEVGGIGANQSHPGRFMFANLAMGLNLIEEARSRNVEKFVLVGTVCAYPKQCPVPFRETDLWNGYPEETNAPYGIAKRTLGLLLDAYRREYGFNGVCLICANLYGPDDNFDPETSHVIAAMIRKFTAAADRDEKSVTCWGTGTVSREFLYVDDAAEAVTLAAAMHNDCEPINIGSGREVRISDLARQIATACRFEGQILWDPSRRDGQPRRMLDTSRALQRLGWKATTDLEGGLKRTVAWWREHGRA